MFVGDAARATDTLTGEGIGQALLTGVLAAQAILDPTAHNASESAALYAKHARQHLAADHHMSSLLSKMLSRPLIARGAVRIVGLNNWTRSNFARWMFEDEARAVALTPRRWHRKFLKQRGAF
jgi:flavin-dependent dehydrogenase